MQNYFSKSHYEKSIELYDVTTCQFQTENTCLVIFTRQKYFHTVFFINIEDYSLKKFSSVYDLKKLNI